MTRATARSVVSTRSTSRATNSRSFSGAAASSASAKDWTSAR
jgi:hypothetical protein